MDMLRFIKLAVVAPILVILIMPIIDAFPIVNALTENTFDDTVIQQHVLEIAKSVAITTT